LLHQVGDLFELNVKLRCQKVKHRKPSNVRNMAEKAEKVEKQFVLGIISLCIKKLLKIV
jgi:hypothetical protein